MRNCTELGCPPDGLEISRMPDEGFFLPAASKTAHHQLKEAARQLVRSYVTEYDDDLRRVWGTERPLELHLPTAIISGRADVILDTENGEVRSLAIVDYKTSADPAAGDDYALELATYADAGRREGLPIEAAYLHDLKAADRQPIDVSTAAITASEQTVESSVADLRQRIFHASPVPAATSTTSAAGTPAEASPPAVHNRYRASTQAAPTPPRRSFGALVHGMRRWRNHTR